MPTARMRAAVSVELPAANGTTTVTGRVGQLCAEAGAAAAAIASMPSANSTKRDGILIDLLLRSGARQSPMVVTTAINIAQSADDFQSL